MSRESVQECGLDGCDVMVELSLRPDGRWRVRHGSDEGATAFFPANEFGSTTGWWPFARTLHDEEGRPHRPESMARQALERLARA